MLFKDLKNGYPIYIFDRSEVNVSQGKVANVGVPHIDSHYGNPTEMVIDITIEDGGQIKTYTFKDGTETGYVNNFVISTSRDTILREVEALKNQSEQELSKRQVYEANIEKCSTILSEFNPAFKEKKENEERFSNLENSVGELKDMIKSLVKELKG